MSTVLITGGAKRVGFAIARFFASKGYNIAIHCNNSLVEARLNAEILAKEFGVICNVYQFNLENIHEVESFFARVIADFDSVEVLINNASFFEQSSVVDSTAESLLKNFSVHLFSPILLSKAFSNQAIFSNADDSSGLIVNMLDKNTTRTKTKYFEYLHSKKALAELTQYLAVTLSPRIRTNAISPGFIIEEEGVDADEDYIRSKLATIPLKKQGCVEDILAAVEYLLNAKYVNGQNLFVDGGAFLIG